jgi:hypothetical protein
MRARVFSSFLLLLALASPALAADGRYSGSPSLGQILPEIRRSTPGTFYDAQGPFPGPDGQARYRIKWMMPDGRIVWFEADAHTGRIVNRGVGSFYRDDDRRDTPEREQTQRRSNFGNYPSSDDNQHYRGGRDRGDYGGRDGGRSDRDGRHGHRDHD